jgi:hypothetical protein
MKKPLVTMRLMRTKNSRKGQLLEYLKACEEGGGDLAMAAICSYYLPDFLYDSGVRGVELQRAVVDAIAQLEVQIFKLKHNYGMGGFPQEVVAKPFGALTESEMSSYSTQGFGLANVNSNPTASFFGNGNPTNAATEVNQEQPQSNVPVSKNDKAEDLDDGFFDDEDDLIAGANIEVDAGFRLE